MSTESITTVTIQGGQVYGALRTNIKLAEGSPFVFSLKNNPGFDGLDINCSPSGKEFEPQASIRISESCVSLMHSGGDAAVIVTLGLVASTAKLPDSVVFEIEMEQIKDLSIELNNCDPIKIPNSGRYTLYTQP